MTKEGEAVESIIKRLGTREDLLLLKHVAGGIRYGDRYMRAGLQSAGVSDLFVVRRLLILPEHVGKYIGRGGVLEVKADLAHDKTEKKRKAQQANFGANVIARGGFFGFVDNADDAERIVYGEF